MGSGLEAGLVVGVLCLIKSVVAFGWTMALQAAGLLGPVKVVLDTTQAHATELCQFVCSESGLFL